MCSSSPATTIHSIAAGVPVSSCEWVTQIFKSGQCGRSDHLGRICKSDHLGRICKSDHRGRIILVGSASQIVVVGSASQIILVGFANQIIVVGSSWSDLQVRSLWSDLQVRSLWSDLQVSCKSDHRSRICKTDHHGRICKSDHRSRICMADHHGRSCKSDHCGRVHKSGHTQSDESQIRSWLAKSPPLRSHPSKWLSGHVTSIHTPDKCQIHWSDVPSVNNMVGTMHGGESLVDMVWQPLLYALLQERVMQEGNLVCFQTQKTSKASTSH